MVTAVDSSVILDVLLEDKQHARVSKAALQQAHREGQLIICETAIAEISPCLPPSDMEQVLTDWNLAFIPGSKQSGLLAGQMYTTYLQRGGRRVRVIPDFLIGAHAQLHAARLLARDQGFYRDYFKGLNLWYPSGD